MFTHKLDGENLPVERYEDKSENAWSDRYMRHKVVNSAVHHSKWPVRIQ